MKKLLLIALFLFNLSVSAQIPGEIDASFNTEGWFATSASISKIVTQPDGKILLGGDIDFFHGIAVNNIIRLNADGSLDNTFNLGTTFVDISTFVLQPDGKIVVVGRTLTSSLLVRLNADGSADPSFTSVLGPTCLALQADGKIIAGGIDGDQVVRLNTDGSTDSSFNSGAYLDSVNTLLVQPDGKIMVAGNSLSGTNQPCLYRLNINGTIDGTYNNQLVTGEISSLSRQSDGKIITSGKYFSGSGISGFKNVIRLEADGLIDNSFLIGQTDYGSLTYSMIQPDGKILIGGQFSTYNGTSANNITRLNSDGTIDNSFTTGIGLNQTVSALAVQSDNKILIGGSFTYYDTTAADSIVRLNSNGSSDSGFLTGIVVANSSAKALCIQSDGKIVVGFNGNHYNNSRLNRLIRLNSDGSTDSSFNIGSGFNLGSGAFTHIDVIVQQADGKLVVSGLFSNYNGHNVKNLVRLNTDGSFDNTFSNANSNNLEDVISMVIQPNGKIIACDWVTNGAFSDVVRFNADGSPDPTFISVAEFDQSISNIVLQSDGKILVGGDFTSYNNTTANGIIRLNADGSIDNSFNSGTAFEDGGQVYSIALLPNGKIMVGGFFFSYNGTTVKHLVRLNSDGTLDTSFNTGTSFNRFAWTIAVQQDGKVLVGGINFSSYNGTPSNRIIRLNSDGSADSSFIIGSGFNSAVNSLAIQSDGKIIVAGAFSNYNGSVAKGIIRLNGNSLGLDDTAQMELRLYPNPVKDNLYFDMDAFSEIKSCSVFDLLGKKIISELTSENTIDVSSLPNGMYILKVETAAGQFIKKFIKD
ncbi:T9SS type A sorting domain-containing protein [Flavobacterium wongokense]|uniref:T9SS type A sorting domain-containing protein n=1 Tax=Flavobacterium wongokense TaxID=2910674 RepID=UPI001F3D952D|nr:T9SS type A sorting domain-containing protein [Flavobacterium sp. WG47]MCF6131530.1 T9SS type A sorting domain-containing protein [Flavobacterium sp. WG47]